jgi:hypothetical protein
MPDRPYDPTSDLDIDRPGDEFRPRPPLRIVQPKDHTPKAVRSPEPLVLRVPDELRDENGKVPLPMTAREALAAARARLPEAKRRLEPAEPRIPEMPDSMKKEPTE